MLDLEEQVKRGQEPLVVVKDVGPLITREEWRKLLEPDFEDITTNTLLGS